MSPGLKRTRGLFMDAPAASEQLHQAATAGVLHEGSQGGPMNEKSPASPWPAGDRTIAIARQPGRAVGTGYQPPFWPAARLSSTASREKVPTFWLGGNSLNVAMYLPMNSCAGTNMNTRSRRQWS